MESYTVHPDPKCQAHLDPGRIRCTCGEISEEEQLRIDLRRVAKARKARGLPYVEKDLEHEHEWFEARVCSKCGKVDRKYDLENGNQ